MSVRELESRVVPAGTVIAVGSPVGPDGEPRVRVVTAAGAVYSDAYAGDAAARNGVSEPVVRRVWDGDAASDPIPVRIGVTNYNPYVTGGGALYGLGNGPWGVAPTFDGDGDPFVAIRLAGPEHGTIDPWVGDGEYAYYADTPQANDDGFVYEATDGIDPSTSRGGHYLMWMRPPYDDRPTAWGASASVVQGRTVKAEAPATWLEGHLIGQPLPPEPVWDIPTETAAGGTVERMPWGGGEFYYTPPPGYVGLDGFVYTVTQGDKVSNVAGVSLTVYNQTPVTRADAYEVPQGGTLERSAADGVFRNDTDLDADVLTAELLSGPAVDDPDTNDPVVGDLTFNPDGSFKYVPPADFYGHVSFTYRADDGAGKSRTSTVLISVTPTRVGDRVWLDADGDGLQGPVSDEPGIGGATVELLDAADGVVATTTTGADGCYGFRGLEPEEKYRLRFINPDSELYEFTTKDAVDSQGYNDDTLDSDAESLADMSKATTDDFNLLLGGVVCIIDVGLRNISLFLPKEITFDSRPERTIWADDGVKKYDVQHWLDDKVPAGKPDTVPENSHPVLFVRDQEVKAEKVVITPLVPSNLDPANYRLKGAVTYRGTSGIVLVSGPGAKVGGDWVYQNLTAGNSKFTAVDYDEKMSIRWTLELIANPATTMRAGKTTNPTYVSFAPVNAPAGANFKMLRTFVHLGSAGENGAAANTTEKIIDRVWGKFCGTAVKTWDEKALVYYKDWIYRTLTETEYTTSYGLVKNQAGECTSFARLFIDALRAQGIEHDDDLFVVQATNTTNQLSAGGVVEREYMFVGKWKKNGGGVAKPGLPAGFGDYKWVNASDEVEVDLAAATIRRLGWKQAANNGPWSYAWKPGLDEMLKDAPDPLKGQNNATPLGVFLAHVLVKISIAGQDVLFDPSYGGKYSGANALRDWENASVQFYAYGIRNGTWNGAVHGVVYLGRENPTAAGTPVDVERYPDQSLKNY